MTCIRHTSPTPQLSPAWSIHLLTELKTIKGHINSQLQAQFLFFSLVNEFPGSINLV